MISSCIRLVECGTDWVMNLSSVCRAVTMGASEMCFAAYLPKHEVVCFQSSTEQPAQRLSNGRKHPVLSQ